METPTKNQNEQRRAIKSNKEHFCNPKIENCHQNLIPSGRSVVKFEKSKKEQRRATKSKEEQQRAKKSNKKQKKQTAKISNKKQERAKKSNEEQKKF